MLATESREPETRIAGSVSSGAPAAVGRWLWRNFIDCSGRLNRGGFHRALVLAVLALALLAVALFLTFALRTTILHGPKNWFYRVELPLWLAAAALFLRPIARRFHDLNLSALHAVWLFTALILSEVTKANIETVTTHLASGSTFSHPALDDMPLFIIASIPELVALALLVWPGTRGPNRYGPPPT